MNTTEKIKAELNALDVQFDSAENRRSGKLDIDQYQRRHSELRERLQSAERAEKEPTKTAAPALTRAELDSIFLPPQISQLSRVDSSELAAFNRNFDQAIAAGDAEAAREILKNERRQDLAHGAHLSRVAAAFRESYKNTGAKSWPALIIGALAVALHEIAESRLIERMNRATRLDPFDDFTVDLNGRTFEFAFRCRDRIVKRAVTAPIPIYSGTWHAGMRAQRGDLVTHQGSLWSCTADTDQRPPSDSWKLCVQRAKDLR